MRKLKTIGLTVMVMLGYGGLFGYIAYDDLFTDKTVAAQSVIASAAAQTPVKQEPTTDPAVLAERQKQAGLLRAAIAMQEYNKRPREASQNCNCGPLIDTYTNNQPGEWCTMFLAWVSRQAGTPVYNDRTGQDYMRQARTLSEHLQKHGTWVSAEEARRTGQRPQVGDFMIYYKGDLKKERLGHATIVVAVDEQKGTVDELNANWAETIVLGTAIPYEEHAGFLGFGRPAMR